MSNIYKPSPLQMTMTSIPAFQTPGVYASDFNCHYSNNWSTITLTQMEYLAAWATNNDLTLLQDPSKW